MFAVPSYLTGLTKGEHTYRESRGVKDRNPVIYIDCEQCGFSTAWMPDETARQVASRWNSAHGY